MPTTEVESLVSLPVAGLSLHEACRLVPEMTPTEWAEFLADVGRRGIQEPLVVQNGKILDGRHRWRAAQAAEIAEVPCRLVELPDAEQAQYVIAAALHRRQLTDSQRAVLAAKYREKLAAKSKAERAAKAGEAGGRNHPKDFSLADNASAKLNGEPPRNAQVVARTTKPRRTERAETTAAWQFGVSERKVRDASKMIKRGSPELVQAVEQGKVSLPAAKALAQLPASKQKAIVAGGEQSIKQAMRQPSMVEELRRLQREKNPDAADRVERIAFIQKLRRFAEELQDFRGDQTHAEIIEGWSKSQIDEALGLINRIAGELSPWSELADDPEWNKTQ